MRHQGEKTLETDLGLVPKSPTGAIKVTTSDFVGLAVSTRTLAASVMAFPPAGDPGHVF